ncbi:uncharacterized protein BDV14DRAFT_18509 [Aspergillus stella-maris]|uniref:uncharacterized protein n=1 Tax=Aspergillus stella-maris TaxID=1810926 RepID=UPI003CCDB24A
MVHCRYKCRRMQSVKGTVSALCDFRTALYNCRPERLQTPPFFSATTSTATRDSSEGTSSRFRRIGQGEPTKLPTKGVRKKKANTGIPKSDCGASDLMQAVTAHPTGKQFHNQPIPPYCSPILKQNPRTNPGLQTAPAEGKLPRLASGIWHLHPEKPRIRLCRNVCFLQRSSSFASAPDSGP